MKNSYFDIGDPKTFIIDFLNEQFPNQSLDEQIEEFRQFSFWDIKDKSKYRNNIYKPSGDCTNLAYAVAWCLWENQIKTCAGTDYTFDKLLNEEKFSGDTICTWKTLFNDPRICKLNDSFISSEIDFSEQDNKDILEFYKLYQSIGNFYLLPNESTEKPTLNTYRGNYYGLKDYFDLFRKLLINHKDEKIEDLVNKNKFFFGDDGNNWEKLRDTFYLEETENLNFDKHFNHSYYSYKTKDEYKDCVLNYIHQSTDMIKNRAQRIANELKEILRK